MESDILHKNRYCYSCFKKLNESVRFCPFCGQDTHSVGKNERILSPGTILNGKYLIGQVIGEGGFGITYKGMDLNLKLKVAIKEYFPAVFATRDVNSGDQSIHIISGNATQHFQTGLEDFAKEANRLSQFAQLEGVVSVLNFFYENNSAYMVMEYIDGITLKDYLETQNGKLSWNETLSLLHPIILSLITIHNTGMIHRDISPDNIMMTESGQMILIDFGAARNVNINRQNTVVLKKGYAPLEQYQSNGYQGTWTDVYSICATIYRMISGSKPEDALAVAGGTIRIPGLKTFDRTLPDFVNLVIQHGMEVLPENRIQTMDELERCLYQARTIKRRIRISSGQLIYLGMILLFISVIFLGFGLWSVNSTQEETFREERGEGTDIESELQQESVQNEESEENRIDDQYEGYADTNADAFIWEETEGKVTITNVEYTLSEIVVPRMIRDMPVYEISGISPNAVSVIIKNGTEKISQGAFKNCVYLEKVYIPASVTEIDSKAFENCISLTDIVVSPYNPNYYGEDGHLYSRTGEKIFD